MPKYVYHYFDIRGRGEPGRMLFAMAGIPFQDQRIPQSDWPQYKAKTPSGSLPYLEIDGTIMTQSLVIFRHLARCFGLDGENLLDKAKVDEIIEYLAEMKESIFSCFLGPQDEESQKKLKEKMAESLTFADIFIFEAFSIVLPAQPNILDKFPKIQTARLKMESHSLMKKYLSQRKETPF
uniref:Glutathione S-transferase 1 n=1 Tax=Magallana gigas TaxID=29159 RepID=K1R7Z0_MAGGI